MKTNILILLLVLIIALLILIIVILFSSGFFSLPFMKPTSEIPLPPSQLSFPSTLSLKSQAFEDQGFIPSKYTCDGEDINPPLLIENVPQEAKSLVLVMQDPDAPRGTFLHWLLWNISPETKEISEGKIPPGAVEGKNDFGKIGYGGPCPPSGTHHYVFTLYALSRKLDFPQDLSWSDFKTLINQHILAQAKLTGLYSRK
jgi:Raf kinase inhibitor-like YbhB/YbcL family protein